jgi:serine acetyltransferase
MNLKNISKKIFFPLFYTSKLAFRYKDPRVVFSCVISRDLPKTTKLPHPIGIVIGKENGVSIGENCIIMQNVTIGVKRLGDVDGPQIGDGVFLGANSVVIGSITIGDNVIIGANCFVDFDVPRNSKVIGFKGKLVEDSND